MRNRGPAVRSFLSGRRDAGQLELGAELIGVGVADVVVNVQGIEPGPAGGFGIEAQPAQVSMSTMRGATPNSVSAVPQSVKPAER
jgi:hypothetical protein